MRPHALCALMTCSLLLLPAHELRADDTTSPVPVTAQTPDATPADCWTIALGGGVAIPLPDSDHLYAPGPAVTLEVSYRLWEGLSLRAQFAASLLDFREGVPIEPGYGKGITTVAGSLGVGLAIPLNHWIDVHLAGGIGAGGFGVHAPEEAPGLALEASAGFRFRFDAHLAMRTEIAPSLIIPTQGSAGGHLVALVRGELSF